MTPAARIQAAIDLLSEIEATPRPADALVSQFFRNRRYIGAKDRQGVAGLVYSVLRHRGRLGWWLDRCNVMPTPRALLLAEAVLVQGRRADSVSGLFNGAKFGPEPLNDSERRLLKAVDTHTIDHPKQPEALALEVPEWAEAPLRAAFGDRFHAEMAAMLGEAPLDLRANPLKATREQVQAVLAEAGVAAAPTGLSPLGLRVQGRAPVSALPVFRDGLFEIQDEGSQLVALLADPRPGMQVVDFCAGAGGKTLAIAAMMDNKGRVVASDVLEGRLTRAKERFRRAGLHNIETRALSSERDPWVKRHKGKFDRVVVDAPCSGTGTWRRNPDSRWRPLGPGLAELLPLQAAILDSAARLVRPGGRLVYATCSLLPEENERQVEAFLAGHPTFRLLPVAEAWPESLGATPVTGDTLRLTPARHDTDGFFAAVMVREEAVEGTEEATVAADAAAAEPPAADV
ncbi:RsmB/NOP family class I SAM-dependent RNA methyltransferase [Rhodocista pekingensis]|uniref:RsmB/NOP family class I SAM-dependent RNA methyltransferase n=1 Tax=Rhodocista pekingensis TaxID=201185 RepID=A0ABW2KY20_9PROT